MSKRLIDYDEAYAKAHDLVHRGKLEWEEFSVIINFLDSMQIIDAEAVPTWIPVEERLPEDDESLRFYDDGRLRFCTVLTYQKIHGVQISNRLRVVPFGNEYLDEQVTNGWKWSFGTKSVTHWMPLSDAPMEDSNA